MEGATSRRPDRFLEAPAARVETCRSPTLRRGQAPPTPESASGSCTNKRKGPKSVIGASGRTGARADLTLTIPIVVGSARISPLIQSTLRTSRPLPGGVPQPPLATSPFALGISRSTLSWSLIQRPGITEAAQKSPPETSPWVSPAGGGRSHPGPQLQREVERRAASRPGNGCTRRAHQRARTPAPRFAHEIRNPLNFITSDATCVAPPPREAEARGLRPSLINMRGIGRLNRLVGASCR